MKKIRKISENFYLVGGEYPAKNFNEAILIANRGEPIKCFSDIESKKISLWRYIKFKFNRAFEILEELM